MEFNFLIVGKPLFLEICVYSKWISNNFSNLFLSADLIITWVVGIFVWTLRYQLPHHNSLLPNYLPFFTYLYFHISTYIFPNPSVTTTYLSLLCPFISSSSRRRPVIFCKFAQIIAFQHHFTFRFCRYFKSFSEATGISLNLF